MRNCEGSSIRVRLGGISAGMAAISIAISGCDASPSTVDPSPSTSSFIASPSVLSSECKPLHSPYKKRQLKWASECLQERKKPVVIINFGSSQQTAKKAAQSMETVIDKSTGGNLKLTVNVVDASLKAKEQLSSLPCVPDKLYAAQIADLTMSNVTKNYADVIALTDKAQCSKSGGRANLETYRQADIYTGNSSDSTAIGKAAAHEWGHLQGWGHAGIVLDEESRYLNVIEPSRKVDLTDFFKNPQYSEYGDLQNIMGGLGDTFNSNPIQIDELHRPESILHGNGVLLGNEIKDTIDLSYQDIKKREIWLCVIRSAIYFS